MMKKNTCRFDFAPVLRPSKLEKVTHTTELSKVDIAFRLLRLDHAFVCNAGRLVGVITRDSLGDFLALREVSPMDECMRCAPPPPASCVYPRPLPISVFD